LNDITAVNDGASIQGVVVIEVDRRN
jgi:hypothetical protein